MRRNFILLYTLLLFHTAHGQEAKGRFEWSLGTGTKSMYQMLENALQIGSSPIKYYSAGLVAAGCRYHVRKRFSVGLYVAYEHIANIRNSHTHGSYNYDYYSLVPEVAFSYMDRMVSKKVGIKLYCTGGWGAFLLSEYGTGTVRHTSTVPLAIQVCPIGIRIGRALAGYAEFGFGYRGVVNAGIDYRVP